ncbi:Os05g0203400 [Oryza sativa Japonica Group]|uniref:Os05g0203400 protein n=1 Tax=Oryza sativa subsp. japonica TaxID=39947 RepID=A0A0P0WJ20_ORYSJ|nr:hypothetical protein EE612_027736 [Oryza sativa]BAS92732.1 Os05g0203400 [Oryza sativa Japonica Group]
MAPAAAASVSAAADAAAASYTTPRNILITGAAGFIASHVANRLLRDHPSYRVVALDKLDDYCATLNNLAPAMASPNFAFVRGDVASADLVLHLLLAERINTVMHFAAHTHVDDNSFEFTKNNVLGTHVLLEPCRRKAPPAPSAASSTSAPTRSTATLPRRATTRHLKPCHQPVLRVQGRRRDARHGVRALAPTASRRSPRAATTCTARASSRRSSSPSSSSSPCAAASELPVHGDVRLPPRPELPLLRRRSRGVRRRAPPGEVGVAEGDRRRPPCLRRVRARPRRGRRDGERPAVQRPQVFRRRLEAQGAGVVGADAMGGGDQEDGGVVRRARR